MPSYNNPEKCDWIHHHGSLYRGFIEQVSLMVDAVLAGETYPSHRTPAQSIPHILCQCVRGDIDTAIVAHRALQGTLSGSHFHSPSPPEASSKPIHWLLQLLGRSI
jgi:hypothetical protein